MNRTKECTNSVSEESIAKVAASNTGNTHCGELKQEDPLGPAS